MKGNHGIEISQPADGIVPMRLLYPPIAANTAAANDPRSPEELKEPEELEFGEPNEFEEADPAYSSATESWGGRQAISDPVSANRSGVFEDPTEMQPDPIYGCPMCNFVSGQDWKSHIEQVHPEYLALLPENIPPPSRTLGAPFKPSRPDLGEKWPCEWASCSGGWPRLTDLAEHIRGEHGGRLLRSRCAECHFITNSLVELERHVFWHAEIASLEGYMWEPRYPGKFEHCYDPMARR